MTEELRKPLVIDFVAQIVPSRMKLVSRDGHLCWLGSVDALIAMQRFTCPQCREVFVRSDEP